MKYLCTKMISYTDSRPDTQAYLDLFCDIGWNKVYKMNLDELSQALDRSWYVVTAHDGEKLVGVGRVVSDGVLYAMIYDLIVRPSHQNNGIGTAILRMLVEKCKSCGVRDIQLFSVTGKAAYYKNCGFIERPIDAPGMRLKRNNEQG